LIDLVSLRVVIFGGISVVGFSGAAAAWRRAAAAASPLTLTTRISCLFRRALCAHRLRRSHHASRSPRCAFAFTRRTLLPRTAPAPDRMDGMAPRSLHALFSALNTARCA